MSDQLTLTCDPLQDAIHWAEHHPDQLEFVLEIARADMLNGVHPSADYCWHCLRRSGLVVRKAGEPVLLNDSLTSSVARLLKRDYGIPFSTRSAKVDGYGVGT
jgi:hypothetical protein